MTETFTGYYGFVVFPDQITAARAEERGSVYLESFARLSPGVYWFWVGRHEAHVTLFQTKFLKEFTWFDVFSELRNIAVILGRDPQFRVNKLGEYVSGDDHYLFWHVDPECESLWKAHTQAADALVGFLDKEAVAQQLGAECAQMNELDRERTLRYGTSIVKEAYLPHITLGASDGAISSFDGELPHRGVFNRVAFVRFGRFGRVEEIIMEAPVVYRGFFDYEVEPPIR